LTSAAERTNTRARSDSTAILKTYVSLANLSRTPGIELIVNLDQKWPAVPFTRKFWEFYLSYILRGKELQFEFEVVKSN
jgi:hypothetical protein